jgi:hypothetical protein
MDRKNGIAICDAELIHIETITWKKSIIYALYIFVYEEFYI